MIVPYLKYRTKAKGAQALHSPFLFKFYNEVVKFPGSQETKQLAQAAQTFFDRGEAIEITDYGAGSRKGNSARTIRSLARNSGTNERWGRFLYSLSQQCGGDHIVELGTNLGIGTAYLMKGNPGAQVTSFEGSENLVVLAQEFLASQNLENCTIHVGRIQENLEAALTDQPKVDLAFIDADHTYEGTMFFFHGLLKHIHEKSVLVFDDIHWSAGMNQAWEELILHERVRLSVDLFYKGIVFFDPGFSKQHFVLKH